MKSRVEISGVALAENFRAVSEVVGGDVEVLAVVKADGYGHGATLCAPVLRNAGANWLGVTDVVEGIAVWNVLGESSTRILVMCAMELSDAPAMVAHGLTPVVWTVEHIAAMEKAAEAAGTRVRVHVEVDTGMSRQGAEVGEELQRVVTTIAASQWVELEGLMTHLCCAEVSGARTTAVSEEQFAKAVLQVRDSGLRPGLLHVGNTSAVDEGGTMAWVRTQAEAMAAKAMVRTGLAMYGHSLPLEGASAHEHLHGMLKPVMRWTAPVVGVREVETGATVGYGASFTAKKPMRLALLPVGYADGFRREASSSLGDGWVMIAGKRAAVVGRVSMNLTVVDVTEIEGVEVGSEAVLLGQGVSAEEHALWAATIPYDILCGVRGERKLV